MINELIKTLINGCERNATANLNTVEEAICNFSGFTCIGSKWNDNTELWFSVRCVFFPYPKILVECKAESGAG